VKPTLKASPTPTLKPTPTIKPTSTPTPTATPTPTPTPAPTPVPKGTITGRGLSCEYHDPIAGCEIKVIDALNSLPASEIDSVKVYYQTTADSNGNYRLDDVAIGTYMILAHVPGGTYGISDHFNVEAGQTIEVMLYVPVPPGPSATPHPSVIPHASVRGKVTLQNGDLVGGGIVRLMDIEHSSVINEITTGDDGKYVFDPVPPGIYMLYAEKNSSTCGYSHSFTVVQYGIWFVDVKL
jgi:hypothetical protein